MGGFDCHGITCCHCSSVPEWEEYDGRLKVEVDVGEDRLEVHSYRGNGFLDLGLGAATDCEYYESDMEEHVDTRNVWVSCSSCGQEVNKDGSSFVLWAWDGDEDALEGGMFQCELGSYPPKGTFEIEGMRGEVMSEERFLASFAGELEARAEVEALVREVADLDEEYPGDGDDRCCHGSPVASDGGSFDCELEDGHGGYHRVEPGCYSAECNGWEVDAWDDDGCWVIGVSVEELRASQLGSDVMSELGL